MAKLFTWQRIKKYPNSGKVSRDIGKALDVSESFDTFMQLNTAEYTPIVEVKPYPTISNRRNRVVPEGGAVSIVDGEIEIDGTSQLTSLYTRDYGYYLSGLIGMPGIGVRIPNPDVGHYEFGYGDDEGNRFGIEVDNGQWYTFIESLGIRYYRMPRSQWLDPLDGTGPSGLSLDLSKFILRMPFGWYGYLSVLFKIAVADRENGDQLVTFDRSGQDQDSVSISQPDLPLFAEANGGVMYVGGRQYGVFGRYKPKYRTTVSSTVSKSVDTNWQPLVTLKSKTESNWSHVPVIVNQAIVSADADVEYAILIGGDLVGASFTNLNDIDPNETALLEDVSSTSITGGDMIDGNLVTVSGQGNVDDGSASEVLPQTIPPGTNITLVVRAFETTANVRGKLKIKEQF